MKMIPIHSQFHCFTRFLIKIRISQNLCGIVMSECVYSFSFFSRKLNDKSFNQMLLYRLDYFVIKKHIYFVIWSPKEGTPTGFAKIDSKFDCYINSKIKKREETSRPNGRFFIFVVFFSVLFSLVQLCLLNCHNLHGNCHVFLFYHHITISLMNSFFSTYRKTSFYLSWSINSFSRTILNTDQYPIKMGDN